MPAIPPIKCGLFQFDLIDYHAILGVPIGTTPDIVRKRYLKVTRILFPDVRSLETQDEEDWADKLLSKFVNPAYENLFKNKSSRSDHLLVLEKIANQATQKKKPRIKSKTAQKFYQAASQGDLELTYQKYLHSLAKHEYEVLEKALERIAIISECNLVYLMLKTGKIANQTATTEDVANAKATLSQAETVSQTEEQPEAKTLSEEEKKASFVEPYLRRGKQFIDKQDYKKAILELREGLQLDPKSCKAHTLLGLAYVKQGQLGMAKVHINKALQIDPKNEMALEGKQVLGKLLEKSQGTGGGGKDTSGKQSNEGKGLLGGFFGKKKNN